MPEQPEGMPCWADVTVPDLAAGKRFYGELFGWTFDEGSAEYGYYTQAFSDGKKVAALAPPMPGGEEWPTAWTVYFASPDVDATAAKVREHGGQILLEPMTVGDFGRMLIAQDPGGVVFGVWQAGTHRGFEKKGEPGSFCWTEIATRDPDAADAFFPAVFPFGVKRMEDPAMDYKAWGIAGETVAGRFKMTPDMPAEMPPYTEVYFAVDNCDEAVATVTGLGGHVSFEPMDTPFGRISGVADQQGAKFALIDPKTTKGDMPTFT
ncbi:VOC family protein [Streptomyces gobiensis]|uniref:VOC family protein n=1 Tax=Streptomyces gobiensis TaxID=2875706 RepID=UPI001E48011C|nr:VOC family protein [Streptomyces gobiensis]UGY95113.1 VOC family protein [Streptomyces gobiensis]